MVQYQGVRDLNHSESVFFDSLTSVTLEGYEMLEYAEYSFYRNLVQDATAYYIDLYSCEINIPLTENEGVQSEHLVIM